MNGFIKTLFGLTIILPASYGYALPHPHADNAPACAPTTQQTDSCSTVVLKDDQDTCANYYVPKSVRSKNTQLMQKCKANKDYKQGSQDPQCSNSISTCQVKTEGQK